MVSVIIPAYNAEKYLSETIQSVINQTYTDWELILVDDGSSDNTRKIAEKFTEKNNRIKYIYQTNSGVSTARNEGLKIIKGEFICFLDADDLWLPNNLKSRIEFLSKNKNIDWIFGDLTLINEKGVFLDEVITGEDSPALESLLLWNGNIITAPSGITIRKKCLPHVSFDVNLSTAADQDFAIQLASKYIGKHFPEATVLYRVLPNSMSRNIRVMEMDHLLVFKKAKNKKLFKSFYFKQKCFSNLYWILAGSWWKNGNNKPRGIYFMLLALIANPFSIFSKLK